MRAYNKRMKSVADQRCMWSHLLCSPVFAVFYKRRPLARSLVSCRDFLETKILHSCDLIAQCPWNLWYQHKQQELGAEVESSRF